MPYAVPQQIKFGVQPDRYTPLGNHLAVALRQKRPAPCRQDAARRVQQSRDHFGFAFAKKRFAVAGEYFRYAQVRRRLDLGVAVQKRCPQFGSHRTAHRRLASPHHPHQDDRLFQDETGGCPTVIGYGLLNSAHFYLNDVILPKRPYIDCITQV